MHGLLRLYHTLRPLRWNQWWYRAWHPVLKRFSRPSAMGSRPTLSTGRGQQAVQHWPVPHSFEPEARAFVFLNRRHRFEAGIDWDFQGEGRLWQFNLQYFEWLYDEDLSARDRLGTVLDFCAGTKPGRSMHAYPASLRIMAWIWFSLRHDVRHPEMMTRLELDADWLRRFPEYHIDGNHLFENGIALCAAGAFLADDRMFRKGTRILREAVADQLCDDGGHCEGSPMYHSLLLWRVLQCVDVLRICRPADPVPGFLGRAASGMLGWLQAVTFSDGTWPAVNDAVAGIAPEPAVLFRAADEMSVAFTESRLSDSGYRMVRGGAFELFVDVGGISPSWQPGHAHADTGNFCLHVHGTPVFVDTGCSSYEDKELRGQQRGTRAHNCFVPGGMNSSDVWSRFRIGKRCRVVQVEESPGRISLTYVTADSWRLRREFLWTPDGIEIRDEFPPGLPGSVLTLHLHPGRSYRDFRIDDLVSLQMDGFTEPELDRGYIAAGFNNIVSSARLLHYPEPDAGHTCVRMCI